MNMEVDEHGKLPSFLPAQKHGFDTERHKQFKAFFLQKAKVDKKGKRK